MARSTEIPLRPGVLEAAMKALRAQDSGDVGARLWASYPDGSRINVEGEVNLEPVLQAAIAAHMADDGK